MKKVRRRGRKVNRMGKIRIVIFLMLFMVLGMTIPVYAEETRPYSRQEEQSKADEYYDNAMDHMESVYYNAMNDVQSGRSGDFLHGRTTGEWFFDLFYGAYSSIKRAAPFVAAISFLLGVVVAFLARKNKGIRKRAIGIGIVGIPLALLLFVFGIGSFIPVFG